MDIDLASGIVRILRSDKETAGTGFVVAGGLIVTCAHVIPAAAKPSEGRAGEDVELVFRISGRSALAEVVAEWWRPADGEDVAFLRLKEPLQAGVRPLPWSPPRGREVMPSGPSDFPSPPRRRASGEMATFSPRL